MSRNLSLLGKPKLKKLSKSTGLLKEEEGVGVWRGVAMMGAPPLDCWYQPAIRGVKRKDTRKLHGLCQKEDILHYPNPKNTSDELPCTNHCKHLEKSVLQHRQAATLSPYYRNNHRQRAAIECTHCFRGLVVNYIVVTKQQ